MGRPLLRVLGWDGYERDLMSTSPVLELQRLAQDSSTSITELLRRTKVVVTKLRLTEAIEWIDHEISGYPVSESVPPYRNVQCELRVKTHFRGWQPVLWESGNPMQEHFSTDKMAQAFAEIEQLLNKQDGILSAPLHQAEVDFLIESGNEQILRMGDVRRVYSRSVFVRMAEAVRMKILELALELERRGIVGEGMTFSDSEKRDATSVIFHVGSVGTLVHGDRVHASVNSNSPGAHVDQTSFVAGQAGAQGKNAVARSNAMRQERSTVLEESKETVMRELEQLRIALVKRASDSSGAILVGYVGEAERAAEAGNYSAMMQSLRSLGPQGRELISSLKLNWLGSLIH